jgi:hypothetical protein
VFELFSERVAAFEERDVVALQRIAEMIMTAVEHANAAKRTDLELRTPSEPEAVSPTTERKIASKPEETQQTTVEGRPQVESKIEVVPESKGAKPQIAELAKSEAAPVQTEINEEDEPLFATVSIQPGKIGKCSSCGFPVSEGRTLCLDCETAKSEAASASGNPDFLAGFGNADQGWFASHKYIIVAMILAVVLVFSLVLKFR